MANINLKENFKVDLKYYCVVDLKNVINYV